VTDTMTFFDMGLDSLLLTQIAFKLEETFGVRATFRQLLKDLSTIKSLAKFIGEHTSIDTNQAESDSTAKNEETFNPSAATPATEAQKEIWISTKWSDEVTLAYLESATISIKGQLNLDIIKEGILTLTKRHDSLRSYFSDDGEQLITKEHQLLEIPLLICQNPEEASELLAKEMQIEFDLETGPLFRAKIIQKQSNDHMIILTAHHTVCDGWSLDVLIEELAKFYNAGIKGQTLPLSLPNQFHHYAVEQAKKMEKESYKQQEQFWLKTYKIVPNDLQIPTDFPRPKFRVYNAEKDGLEIGEDAVRKARIMSSQFQASLFSTLLATLKIVFYRLRRYARGSANSRIVYSRNLRLPHFSVSREIAR
jgi:hypothetical protein